MTKKSTKFRKRMRPTAIGTGLVALDEVLSADRTAPVRRWAGGTCGNVLIALKYLGWNSKPVARLGTGQAAELLLADLRRWHVSEHFVRVEDDGSTPIIVQRISKDAKGNPKHSFSWRCTGCGAPFPGYKPELATVAEQIAPKIKKSQLFFFDRVSAGALVLARAAADAGALVVFEPSGIGNPLLFGQAWEVAHVVKYSHERLSDFPEMNVETSPRLVIETLGDAGLRYRWRKKGQRTGKWVDSKALLIHELRDTAGAGDWCTAGVLSKIANHGFREFSALSDQQLADAIRYGQALASWCCRFEGARGGMYAVTKQQFTVQVDGILAGTANVVPIRSNPTTAETDANTFCRICEHSTGETKVRKSR